MPILEALSWAAADFAVFAGGSFRVACQGVYSFSIDRVDLSLPTCLLLQIHNGDNFYLMVSPPATKLRAQLHVRNCS